MATSQKRTHQKSLLTPTIEVEPCVRCTSSLPMRRSVLSSMSLSLCWSVSWAHKLRHVMAHVPAAADRTDPSKMVPDNLSSWVRSAPQNQSHIEAEIFKSVPSNSSGIYYTSATMAAALQTLSTSALTVKAVRPCRRSRATVTKARHPCHNNLAMSSTT